MGTRSANSVLLSPGAGTYLRRAWPYLRSAVVQSIGLVGFGVFLYGLWQLHQSVALVVGGALMVVWTILKMRSLQEEP